MPPPGTEIVAQPLLTHKTPGQNMHALRDDIALIYLINRWGETYLIKINISVHLGIRFMPSFMEQYI